MNILFVKVVLFDFFLGIRSLDVKKVSFRVLVFYLVKDKFEIFGVFIGIESLSF